LRELPESLIPEKWVPKMLSAQSVSTHQMRAEYLQTILVRELGVDEFQLISEICLFLRKVLKHEKENKMGLDNLATIFGPNIVKSGPLDFYSGNTIMKMLIEDCALIFTGNYVKVAKPYETVAIYVYNSSNPKQELSLKKGEKVYVFGRWDNEWLLAEAHSQLGLVPEAFLQKREESKI